MTKREFLEAISAGTINEEVVAFATDVLSKMDATNAKRTSKAAQKKAEENAPLFEALREVLNDKPQTTSELAAAIGVSTSKASALLRQMVANGEATVSDVKVTGKAPAKAYAIVG